MIELGSANTIFPHDRNVSDTGRECPEDVAVLKVDPLAAAPLADVTFAFRDSRFMRRLTTGFESRAPEFHVVRKVIPETVPTNDCYDPDKVGPLLGKFPGGVVVTDNTLYEVVKGRVTENPVRAYDALRQFKADPVHSLVEEAGEIVGELRIAGRIPVLIEQHLGDHMMPIGFNAVALGLADAAELRDLPDTFDSDKAREVIGRFRNDARGYANLLDRHYGIARVTLEQFSVPFDFADRGGAAAAIRGNPGKAIAQLSEVNSSNDPNVVLLVDHHMLPHIARNPELGLSGLAVVLICPCCAGTRGTDRYQGFPDLVQLKMNHEWDDTVTALTALVRARQSRIMSN